MEHNNAPNSSDYFQQPQRILITGSSSGIGFACARFLTQEFCRVYPHYTEQQRQSCSLTLILTGRNKAALQQAQNELLALARHLLPVGVPAKNELNSELNTVGVPLNSELKTEQDTVGVLVNNKLETEQNTVGVPVNNKLETEQDTVGVPLKNELNSELNTVGVLVNDELNTELNVVGVLHCFAEQNTVGVLHCFRVELMQCDHSNTEQVNQLTAQLLAAEPPEHSLIPTAVIANVGMNPVHQLGPKKVATTSTELLLSTFQTNVANTHALLAPLLKRYKQQGGKVVLTGSQAYQFGVRGQLAYNVSKAALVGYFNTVRSEFAGRNVYCHLINPGVVENQRTANLRSKNANISGEIKISSEADVANAICQALMQNEQHNLQLNV